MQWDNKCSGLLIAIQFTQPNLLHNIINNMADGTSLVLMSSGAAAAVETKDELERIKEECSGMINTLKALHDEEKRLREGNQILAQQAVLMGCTAGFDAGARRGAGRKRPASGSSATAASNNNPSAAKKAKTTKKNTTSPPVNVQGGGTLPSKTPISVKMATAATKNQPNGREKCDQVIKVLLSHGIFTNLTHPARVAEGFVDLTIHMRVIQKKIESNAFASSFDLFKADVRQLFDSCLQGSQGGSQFHEVVKDLKKSYEFTLANINQDTTKA